MGAFRNVSRDLLGGCMKKDGVDVVSSSESVRFFFGDVACTSRM
jgi:hypothetical protein